MLKQQDEKLKIDPSAFDRLHIVSSNDFTSVLKRILDENDFINEVVFQDNDSEETEDSEPSDEASEELTDKTDHGEAEVEENPSEGKTDAEEEIPGIDEEADGDLLGQSDPYGNEPPEDEVDPY